MRVNKLNSNKYQKQWKSLSFVEKKKWKRIASKIQIKLGYLNEKIMK